jgi:hypothetical protein
MHNQHDTFVLLLERPASANSCCEPAMKMSLEFSTGILSESMEMENN